MKSTSYARPIENGTKYEYAPASLWPNPGTPTEAEYNAAGWYRYGIEPPSPPEGKVVAATSYVIADNKCVAVYTYADAPKRVRIFSTADIIEILMQKELWNNDVKHILESRGMLDIFLATKEIHEDYPNFIAARDALQQALSVSDAEVEEILTYAEVR